jgi:hypothetical protein
LLLKLTVYSGLNLPDARSQIRTDGTPAVGAFQTRRGIHKRKINNDATNCCSSSSTVISDGEEREEERRRMTIVYGDVVEREWKN